MKPLISRFFDELSMAVRDVEVSDASGRRLDFLTGLEQGITLVRSQTGAGRKVMFIGNGGSAAIASHQALDYWRNGGMRAVAFNDPVLLTCLGNDFGYPTVFERAIDMFADPGDVLAAISSSGRSENILRGARKAREKRCVVVTMSGFDADNPLRALGDLNFYVPARSYGAVEIAHLSLCHCILDTIHQAAAAPAAGARR